MKKFLYLAGLILLSAIAGFGQTNIPTFQYVNAAPSGLCPSGQTQPIQIVYTSGLAYSCNAGVWGPFAGTGGTGATLPTNAMVFGLSPITSRAAVPNQDFVSPVVTNGMAPTGTAVTGANFSSNIFTLSGSYCTGSPCAPGQDTFSVANIQGAGVNPTQTLTFSHFGSSGVTSGLFNFPISLATGSTGVTQTTGDNSTKLATDAFVLANQTPGGVTSVFTRTGAVTATSGDYSVGQITGAAPLASPTFTGVPAGPTAANGTNTTQLATTAFVLANGGSGGTPGGNPTDVQFNNTGSFGGDDTFSFTAGSHTLGYLNVNMQAQGVASTGFNQDSGTSAMEADVCTLASPCTPAGVFYGEHIYAGTGPNPNTLKDHNCVSTSTGPCEEAWEFSVADQHGFSGPTVDAQFFGAYGDAYQPPNGCSVTATVATATCGDSPFVSTDVGKQFWESGAGAAGVAFNATITAVSSGTTVSLSAAPSTSVSSGRAIYGHDDVTAIQACFQYSATNAVQCVLRAAATLGNGLNGFLIGTAPLQLVANNFLEESSATNITGAGQINGTNLFCEINGDCLSLASGPIQGANVANLSFEEDSTQPNSRSIHLNPSAGTFGPGPFTNSNFTNVSSFNPSKECIFFDGGGGPGYAFDLPNQYLIFKQFWCTGPNQSHPANLILATGQNLQVIFMGGQVNGQGWTISGSGGSTSASANYPNPLVELTEKTSTLGDSPVDWKFYGFTNEVGTQGYYFGNGTDEMRIRDGYFENISSPIIAVNSPGVIIEGDHFANSGNIGGVAQFTGGVTASMQANYVFGSINPATFAACSGSGNHVDFGTANNSTVMTVSSCKNTLVITGGTQGTGTPCSTPVTQTVPGLQPGMTVTLGYSSDPTSLTGWGGVGGMRAQAWASAANTMSSTLCNLSASSITYSGITFTVDFE